MLGNLAPHHREKLARLLSGTPEFSPADAACALELIDVALDHPEQEDYRFLLCEDGDRVLGYACFGSASMAEGAFDLYWMVVDKEARRSGIGREILSAVEELLRGEGARLIRLETAGIDSYAAARAFYQRTGYSEAGRVRDFYWPGNDLYIYVKYLAA